MLIVLMQNDGRRLRRYLLLLLAILLVKPLAHAFAAQGADITCPSGHFKIENTISSTLYSAENISDIHPQLLIDRGRKSSSIEIVLNGPVLGVESSDFKANLVCTSDGVKISGTILQNPDYHGVQTASYIWRPIIKVTAILNKTDINITSIWQMRLPSGAAVSTVDTPLNSHQSYPITIKKTFHLPMPSYIKH